MSLAIGIGIPIPILDEDMARFVSIRDEDVLAPVIDYSDPYPNRRSEIITHVNYRDLRSGVVEIRGKQVPSASLSSYPMAREIARTLKEWVEKGSFFLSERVCPLPGADSGRTFKSLEIRKERGSLQ